MSIIRWIAAGILIVRAMAVYGQAGNVSLARASVGHVRNVLASRTEKTDDRKSDEYRELFLRMMDEYDEAIRSCPDDASAWGNKALYYLRYAPCPDKETAYLWLKKSMELSAPSPSPAVALAFLETSMRLAMEDGERTSRFLQDYERALPCSRQFTDAERERMDATLVGSNLVNGKLLQQAYTPRVRACGQDTAVLHGMQRVMEKLRFTDNGLYREISDSLYQVSPSVETAVKLGNACCLDRNIDRAVECFERAMSLEEDGDGKAGIAYGAADALRRSGQWLEAKAFCQKALLYRKNYGKAYVLMADLYASDIKWSKNADLNKCTYFLVIDMLMRAKAVDPDLTGEVNEAISMYASHTPKTSDLFLLGYQAGDRITIGGWIDETTTIR